jgi:hypothetical protein
MECETFKPRHLVSWSCLFGSARVMGPIMIRIMLDLCMETQSKEYFVSRVEDVPEDSKGSVGHHQWVWLEHPTTREEIPQKFSGCYFTILAEGITLTEMIARG